MFALLSTSLYEDVFKKILFESPLEWNMNDSISMLFVLLFFFGLLMMPSILEGESSQLKNGLQAWFNKDARRLKKLRLSFKELDKKYQVNIYNIDLLDDEHWMWKLIVPTMLKHFVNIDFHVRSDQKRVISKRLKKLDVLGVNINDIKTEANENVELLLSQKETSLYTLMHLSSTAIVSKNIDKQFVSLELF
jgi:hypothetical protein